MADAKSLTVHASQGKAAPQHDKREYTPPNACRALEANNVCVVRVEDEVQAFNDFFQPHVEAFNEKQKRADRKKSLDYHAEVVERRAKSKGPDHETKPFYEYVIGVGDRNGVMGVTDSEFDNAHWRRLKDGYTDEDGNEVAPDYKAADEYVMAHLNDHPDREGLKRALTEYMEGLQERYPNFQFVSNEGHDDEPNGTFHFHVRFFPVADGYKKGMETRCGLNKALAAMGFSGGDQLPITQWQNDVKNGLEEVLKECGYEREYGDGRKYRLDTASYVLSEEMEDYIHDTAETVAELETRRDSAKKEAEELEGRVENMGEQVTWAAGVRDAALNEAKAADERRVEAEAKVAKADEALANFDKNLDDALEAADAAERYKSEKKKLEKERDELTKGNDELRAEHERIAASPPEVKVTFFDADPEKMLPSILEAAADWYTERSRQQDGKAKQRSETMATLFREAVGDLQKENRNGETLLSRMMQFVRSRLLKKQGQTEKVADVRDSLTRSDGAPSAHSSEHDRSIGE